MEAIILAGGFGTRLKAVVPDLPKPMAPIVGRPFLEILLGQLVQRGFSHIILSLGYRAEVIRQYFGRRFQGVPLDYCVETTPLGTGGAIRASMQAGTQGHLYVFNGDTFLDLEVAEVEALWLRNGNPVIVGRAVDDTARYGRLLYEDSRVSGFAEKGCAGPGLINAGCYVLNRGMLDAFAIGQPFSIESDFLVHEVSRQRFDVFVSHGHFIDIGIPEDYARAQRELAGF